MSPVRGRLENAETLNMNPMIAFLHGDKKDKLETLSLPPQEYLKETKIQKELDLLINQTNIFSSETEIISNALKKDGLLIAILNAATGPILFLTI